MGEATFSKSRAFGKYRVIEKIGAGGFGEVFKGLDPALNRPVAIKTCSSVEDELRKRFLREAEIAANLQHPNVVTIFDLGYQDETPYLVQEFLSGEDLDHKIRRRKPVDVATRVDYLLQIARGLEYAHSRDVVHRDVKPANVRILDDGQIRIMDFGIAKLMTAETQLTRTGMALGTAAYLPPEQIMGLEIDPRADLFSYGVVAYELMTWQRPFAGESLSAMLYAIAHKEPEPVAACGADCPPRLATLIETCLAKDPQARYPSFSQVIAELESLSSETLAAVPPVPPPAKPEAAAPPMPPPVPPAVPSTAVDGTVQTVAMRRPAADDAAPRRRGAATWILIGAAAAAVLVAAGLGVTRLLQRSPEPRIEPEPAVLVADAPPPGEAEAPVPGEALPPPDVEEDAGVEAGAGPEEPEAAAAEPSPAATSRPAAPPRQPAPAEAVRPTPPPAPEEPEATPPPESQPQDGTEEESAPEPPADAATRAPLLARPSPGLDFGRIVPGLPAYSDRAFIYEQVPEAYLDLPSVRTANDLKRSAKPIFFSLAREAEVFVAHDQRILRKPAWLQSFRRTGQTLTVNEGGAEQKIAVYDVFVEDFASGVVALGRNVGLRERKKRMSMYLVFVREK